MAEGEHNATLQEIAFDGQNQMQSINDISTIQYEANFNYLKDKSVAEYLLIEDLKLQPEKEQYEICFYVNKEQKKEGEERGVDQIDFQEDGKQKIVTLNTKNNTESTTKQSVRLPTDRKSIQFQLKTLEEGIARGYLIHDVEEVNQGQSPYYNDMGVQLGSLHYKRTICKQTNQNNAEIEKEAQELIDQSSLHQDNLNKTKQKYELNKFIDNDDVDESSYYPESYLSVKIQKQLEEEMPLPKNSHEGSNNVKKSIFPALNRIQNKSGNSQIVHAQRLSTLRYKQPRYLKKKVLEEIQSQQSEKDSVNYRYEEDQSNVKITPQYKTPIFAVEKPKSQRKAIDFEALKRSSQDLGLKHRNIEAMICPQLINKKKFEPLAKITRPEINQPSQMRPLYEIKHRLQFKQSSQSSQARPAPEFKQIHHYQKEDASLSESIMKQQPVTFSTPSPSKSHKPGFIRSHRQKSTQNSQKISKTSNQATARNKQPPIIKILTTDGVNTEISGHIQKSPRQLSVSKGIIQINIGDEQSKRSSSLTPYRKGSVPQRQYSQYNPHSFQSYELGEADKFIDILVTNLSINFHKKIFGRKYAQILLSPFSYTTDYLHGNHLLWIGKTYLFKRVTPDQTMVITVKCESQFGQIVLGKVQISTTDLLLNHKKSYYQTYLTRNDETLAVVILGFQTSTRSTINTENSHKSRLQHARTEVKNQKSKKSLIISTQNTTKRSKILEKYIQQSKLERPICSRLNPIRVRKATAAKQERMRKVSRYISEPLQDFDMEYRYNSQQK